MNTVLALLILQAILGAFDNLYHHELRERLPARRAARGECGLHAVRELLYGALFYALAWREWHGAWAWLIAGVLALEVLVTIVDFLVEDATRRLPRTERALHTVLAMNFGVILAGIAPVLMSWHAEPTAIVPVDHGAISALFTAFAIAVLLWGLRDALAMARWYKAPAWQKSGFSPAAVPSGRSVLVTGATGFIGRRLVRRLVARGDDVIVLTRDHDKAVDAFGPHAEVYADLEQIDTHRRIDAIVNLAGAPIATMPWTARRRRTLLESRLGVTGALLELVARLERKPRTWVNASAIGFYGARRDDVRLHEKTPAGAGFQSRLCAEWEALAARAREHDVKVAALRIGLVLGTDGGALPALARPVRLGLGCVLGDGSQWVSWIHIDDLIALIEFVLDQGNLAGPCNATAPEPVKHGHFMRALARSLRRHLTPLKIPAPLLRAALGELAELFVDGQRVLPERAIALGFEFRYRKIDDALEAALDTSAQASVAAADPSPSPGRATR